jgi:hypothetical protein
VNVTTAHIVGVGHILFGDKPLNIDRAGEFLLYDNIYTGEKVHVMYRGYKYDRITPEWFAASKIAMKYRNRQISIEANPDRNGCPILRQDCTVVTAGKQLFASDNSIPLYFDSAPQNELVVANPCQQVIIRNNATSSVIECHMWHGGFMSCHMIFRAWDGMYGMIFDRITQGSADPRSECLIWFRLHDF